MAKVKKIETMDLAQIEAEIATVLGLVDEKRAAYKRLSAAIGRDCDRLTKLEEARSTFVPMTLDTALVALLPTGDNSVGHQWLQDMSWKGAWKDTGFRFNGCYWPETNQRVMTVWSNHSWDDAKLAVQAATIMSVLSSIKAGVLGKVAMIKLSKTESADMNTMQVFEIFDQGLSANANWKLAAMDDGRWIIYDSYSARHTWGQARKVGTLMECLQEMRAYLYYEGPRSDDEDD